MVNGNFRSEENNKVSQVALEVINNKMNAIEGCRRIIPILYNLGKTIETYEPLKILVGIDSQTDHFPFGKTRDHYDKNYLDELDHELEECMRLFKDDIFKACRKILQDLSKE